VQFKLSNNYKYIKKLKTSCGSSCYAAPEMIAGKKYNGLQVDIWSCGVILFAMQCGYLPLEDSDTTQLYKKYSTEGLFAPEARSLLGILNLFPTRDLQLKKSENIHGINNHHLRSIKELLLASSKFLSH